MRRTINAILLLTLIGIGVGCKPPVVDPVDHERSYLHILSASQAQGNYDLAFDYWNTEGQIIPDFYYKRNWPLGGYGNLLAGGQPDEFGNGKLYMLATQQPFINVPIDTVMIPTALILEPGVRSTICIVDSAGTLAFDHFVDDFSNPGAEVNLRLINLQAGQGPVGLRSTDSAFEITNVTYRSASAFVRVPAGTFNLEVMDETGTNVLTTWNGVNIAAGVTYSFYLSGSGSSDLAVFVH